MFLRGKSLVGLILALVACGDNVRTEVPRDAPDAPPDGVAPVDGGPGADAASPIDGPVPVPTDVLVDSSTADAAVPQDSVSIDAPVDAAPDAMPDASPDAPSEPEGVPECSSEVKCTVTVLSSTSTAVTVGWRICCTGEAVAMATVGINLSGGPWSDDSQIVTCGQPYSATLALAVGSSTPWATVDTLEWPYTMDSGIFRCGTPGAPQ